MDKLTRYEYLMECYRTSNQELLFRCKHRDHWIKIQLLGQIVLLSLALGVEISGVRASSNVPIVLALALPVSVVLLALYSVEDRLVSHIIHYIKFEISHWEAVLSSANEIIPNLEMSEGMSKYEKSTLFLKTVTQSVAFLFIPICLAVYWLSFTCFNSFWEIIGFIINIICGVFIILLLIWTFLERWRLHKSRPNDNKTA
jgi:hypothetical protein